MSHLSRLYPLPTPVLIGEQVYPVEPITVRKLAYLQSFVEAVNPHPATTLPLDPDYDTLVETFRKGQQWPSSLFESREHLGTLEGLAFFLAIALDVPMTLAMELAQIITMSELEAVEAAAWQVDPQETVVRLIDPAWGQDSKGEKKSWGERLCKVAEVYGWTFEEIGDMTLAQFYTACNPGYQAGVKKHGE